MTPTLDKPLRKPAPPPTPHTSTYWPPRKCNRCNHVRCGRVGVCPLCRCPEFRLPRKDGSWPA